MDLNLVCFDPSRAVQRIMHWDAHSLTARTAPGIGPHQALEAMAQACGLHLRHRHAFRVRAYLATISDLVHEPALDREPLTIRATLTSETGSGAAYAVDVDGVPACRMVMGFSDLDAPDTFFRHRFERLCTPSSNA